LTKKKSSGRQFFSTILGFYPSSCNKSGYFFYANVIGNVPRIVFKKWGEGNQGIEVGEGDFVGK